MWYLNLSSQEILKSMECWVSSFSENTSKNISSLYDVNAFLWGTLSPIKRDSAVLIKNYFDQLFKYENRYVTINDSNIRLLDNMAISSGFYTFSWFDKGVKVTTEARFSFVYVKKDGCWFIIEHHSSAMPVAV